MGGGGCLLLTQLDEITNNKDLQRNIAQQCDSGCLLLTQLSRFKLSRRKNSFDNCPQCHQSTRSSEMVGIYNTLDNNHLPAHNSFDLVKGGEVLFIIGGNCFKLWEIWREIIPIFDCQTSMRDRKFDDQLHCTGTQNCLLDC